MAQRLDTFDDDGIAQRRIRHLELALAHHALASWRVSSSPSALKCRRQMSAISPFLKKP
jgi:hypothetical protein